MKAITNLGRWTSIIAGISGVSVAGGSGLANLACNCRYHWLTFFCTTHVRDIAVLQRGRRRSLRRAMKLPGRSARRGALGQTSGKVF